MSMPRSLAILLSSFLAAAPLVAQEFTKESKNAVGRVISLGVVLSSADFVGGGTFDYDKGGTIRVRHFPVHHTFRTSNDRLVPWLLLAFGSLSDREPLDVFGEPFDRAKLATDSLAGVAGVEIDLGSGWYSEPSLGVIFSRVEVDLEYRNPQTVEFRPIFEGVFFNWDADAWTLAAATRLGYRHVWQNGFGLDLAAQGVGLWTDPVNTDHPVQNTSSNAQYLRLQSRLRLPLGAIRGNDLYLVPEAVHTLLSKEIEQVMESDTLTQLSLRLVADLPEASPDASLLRRLFPHAIGFNAGHTTADGFSGWTFGMTFRSWASGW